MRRTLMLVAVTAVAASAMTAVAAAVGAGSGGLTAPARVHVVERPLTDEVIDIGAKGDSPGDQLPFNNPIYNWNNTRKVGVDQGNCIRASAVTGRWECMWTTFLPRGQVTVEGPFLDARATTQLAITGGTGEYSNARGWMTLHVRRDGNFDFIFHFRP
jgi:allene oxide cyclase